MIYPAVSPRRSLVPDAESKAFRELPKNEINLNLSWISFPLEMFNLQMASALSAVDLGGTYATQYSCLVEQIAAYGPVIDMEVDPSHGVFRSFRMFDPIDRFPILDSEVDLNNGQISSNAVKRIVPSQFDQMVTKNIRGFMQPEFDPEQALRYLKEFVRKGEGPSATKPAEQKVDAVTSEFYTFWEDKWTPDPTA